MNKLKSKILIILILILTLFLLSMTIIFNISIYNREYKELKDKLIRIENNHERFKPDHDKGFNPLFVDNDVYVVSFDNIGNIDRIISYSSDELSKLEIRQLIDNNVDKITNNKIENLYFNKYIFFMSNNRELIIINCSDINNYLVSSLRNSIILFILLEILIVYLSVLLTRWLVRPVVESFMKQKQFIYDASHELKTPISIILASAETLENNPQEVKWIENIKSETTRMNKLVINLLELSKSEDIKENEVYTNINISKLIEKKALSFESVMFENQLTLVLNIERDIMFNCNQDRIKELVSILIDNAIKYGYKKSKIEVSLYKEKNNILLEVKNRGEEIPEGEREKIFERFYRVDKSRNRNDNRYGLGLSIAKNIVINHNGNIKVVCKNGYTTFIVTFKQN